MLKPTAPIFLILIVSTTVNAQLGEDYATCEKKLGPAKEAESIQQTLKQGGKIKKATFASKPPLQVVCTFDEHGRCGSMVFTKPVDGKPTHIVGRKEGYGIHNRWKSWVDWNGPRMDPDDNTNDLFWVRDKNGLEIVSTWDYDKSSTLLKITVETRTFREKRLKKQAAE